MRTSRSWACRDGEFHTYRLSLLRLCGTDETLHGPLQSRRLEQACSYSHGKAIWSTYKLYRFTLLLLQDDVTTLIEDRVYDLDRAAWNWLIARTAIVAETEMDASDDYVFVNGMFHEAVYQKLRVPRFRVLPEQCIPGRFSSLSVTQGEWWVRFL